MPSAKGSSASNRMIRRIAPLSGLDDFPTPPWATRALSKFVLPKLGLSLAKRKVLDPACGRGYMVEALRETGADVSGSDIHDYGGKYAVRDFTFGAACHSFDWIITNPPYKVADRFFVRARETSRIGVAFLVRLNWLQGNERGRTIFESQSASPSAIGIFSSRIPFAQGKIVQRASVFFQHVWVVWRWAGRDYHGAKPCQAIWIPSHAQSLLERTEDYK